MINYHLADTIIEKISKYAHMRGYAYENGEQECFVHPDHFLLLIRTRSPDEVELNIRQVADITKQGTFFRIGYIHHAVYNGVQIRSATYSPIDPGNIGIFESDESPLVRIAKEESRYVHS